MVETQIEQKVIMPEALAAGFYLLAHFGDICCSGQQFFPLLPHTWKHALRLVDPGARYFRPLL